MSKIDEATKRARERELARKNGGELPASTETALATRDEHAGVPALPGISGMVSTDGHTHVIERLKSGEWEAAPQILIIKPGQTVIAHLEGKGPQAEVEDPRTRELKLVDTWILRSLDGTGVRASILTTAQLDKKLPPFQGGAVSITRGETFDTGSGRRVTEYLVAGPTRADGTKRTWATPVEQEPGA